MLAKDVCRAESIDTLECVLAREVIFSLDLLIHLLDLHLDIILFPRLLFRLLLNVPASREEPALDFAAGFDLVFNLQDGVVGAI